MKRLFAALVLLPTPALANFECSIDRQCGGGTCEAFSGGPMTVREIADTWQVEVGDVIYDGYATTTLDLGGEVSIVVPPQQGISGLINIYPSGEVLFTVHAYSEGAVAITGSGTCTGEGG